MNKFLLLSLLFLWSCTQKTVVDVTLDPTIVDYSTVIKDIIAKHPKGEISINFGPGVYEFYPEEASERYLAISNNDNGNKRIAFLFDGSKNIDIQGDNTEFLFHGSIIPFAFLDCTNVSVKGISFDYDYSFVLEGKVLDSDEAAKSFTMQISSENCYEVRDNQLYIKAYDWELPLGENIVFNAETRSPYRSAERFEWSGSKPAAEDLGERKVRLSGISAQQMPPIGSIYTDKGPHGSNRRYPGFVIQGSKGVSLENVCVYCSGAMALIAERSKDIVLNKYKVQVREGSPRMLAASADATHFINCGGEIKLIDCTFESMLDDATNIHGTYMKVDKVLNNKTFQASFGHFQQEGFDFASVGEGLRFINRKDLSIIGESKVIDVKYLNENCYEIRTDFDLSGYNDVAVENVSYYPTVEISGCSVQKNRARSLLISTAGDVLIENNYFASMMAGIRICGDANYWFESGRTSNIVIKDNIFKDLGNGGWSPQAVLQIDPVLADRSDKYYHNQIRFENNTIYSDESQLIYALSVESLSIKNNTFISSSANEARYPGLSTIDIQTCGSVDIEGNNFEAWKNKALLSVLDTENISSLDKGLILVDNPNNYFYEN